MYIKQIVLRNYRIYHGENKLDFPKRDNKNVFIVSGNNGFGKTTLLTSLVWGLYGKLMVDVDDKFRREIYDAGGYKKYASSTFNRLARSKYIQFLYDYPESRMSEIKAKNLIKYDEMYTMAKALRSYSVSILITDLNIPSLPCNNIEIIRTFDIDKKDDIVQILIDGQENELTKEVGDEIFINDFLLPKEIAKFFFFDAEKIVSLAEIKSIEDKRNLSKAYSEVLGIKKYEDLKINLEDLRIRFRRNSASEKDKLKLNVLQKETEQLKKLVDHNTQQLKHWEGEKEVNKQNSEQLQEKLIREGNALSVNELADLKEVREQLTTEANTIKNKIKDLLDIAPFAISGQLFMNVKEQQEKEQERKSANPTLYKKKLERINSDLIKELKAKNVKSDLTKIILKAIETSYTKHLIGNKESEPFKILLAFEDKETNEFEAIYNNLKYSFSNLFKQLVKDYKNNRIVFNKVIRKISSAETKENDMLIKEIRISKKEVDDKLIEIDAKLNNINQEIGGIQKEIAIKSKVLAELGKKVELEESDRLKDETAERLITELEKFIIKFKLEKKESLETRIKKELNLLMHKKNFINSVKVVINGEVIDINLYDKRNQPIETESLSKGEQQLYATSLLKALVDESNINFPVFIDSPLQKFDKKHSINIIKDFYPNISDQVVLFPLLEKELSESEFETLLPKVNKAYLIRNVNEDHSTFVEIEPKELFNMYKKDFDYVHNN
jgi:DNA sulfur modification protein DndD